MFQATELLWRELPWVLGSGPSVLATLPWSAASSSFRNTAVTCQDRNLWAIWGCREHTTLGFFLIPNVPGAMGQEELGVSMGVQSNTEPH